MSRLKLLSIENFRGFYDKQEIEFAIPEVHGLGLTIIVGPNNSGKTTLIEALKKFSHDVPQLEKEERHGKVQTEIKIVNDKNEVKILKNPQGSVCVIENKSAYPQPTDFYLVSSRRYWTTYFGTNKLSHLDHKRFSLNVDRFGNDSNFGQRMIEIQENAEKKLEYDLIIKKLIPNFSNWHIELSRGQNYIEYITGNGDMHNSEFFGDGVISLFKIALTLLSDQADEILIIDEPELSLHPQAQKRLIQVLSEHSSNKQIILTTHSPYFVRWEDIEKGGQIIRLNKPLDKNCVINFLNKQTSKEIKNLINDWQKPQLLDIVAKEIFFGINMIFVEGQEDKGLILKFCKEEKIDLNFEIFGYGSGGSGNIKYFLKMAKELGLKAGAIFDGNKKSEFQECEKEFSSFYRIQIISKDDIRDKSKDNFFDGLFEESGKIKSENGKKELKTIIEEFNTYFLQE